MRGSKLGLALFAIRDDEDRARGLGVQTTLAKLTAFAVSAGLVAMAGGIWAYYIGFIYPQFAVDPLVTIGMVLMVYLGGRGTLWGPVLGAFILVPAQQYLAYRLGASELYLVGYSAVFLVVMLLLPRGILPSLRDRARRMRVRRRARAATRGGGRLMTALLEVEAASKRFGGVVAVDGCSLSVQAGTVTGLIGPNGSGKTTVFNLVTGYLPADGGTIRFDGRVVRRPDPTRLARRGLIRTFQQARVFPNLTVVENLVLATPQRWWQARARRGSPAPSARAPTSCSPTSASPRTRTRSPPSSPSGSASCSSSPRR